MIAGLIHLVGKVIWNAVIVLVCASLVFIGYKANHPMTVAGAPKGMTYAEFLQDRLDAAKTVEPARCGWGMMLSLAALGPIYSVVYTEVAINPGGFLDKVTAPDPDIPTNVAGAKWVEVPGIWWNVVERLSWTMLVKQSTLIEGILHRMIPEYPEEALREALVNAVAHRDYSSYVLGSQVGIEMFADRLEIISPGGLFGPVSLTNLETSQASRNQLLIRLLSEVGLVENRGSGIRAMVSAMREAHLEPQGGSLQSNTSGSGKPDLAEPVCRVRAKPSAEDCIGVHSKT